MGFKDCLVSFIMGMIVCAVVVMGYQNENSSFIKNIHAVKIECEKTSSCNQNCIITVVPHVEAKK